MRITQTIGLKLIILLLILSPLTLPVGTVYAETQYVSDKLVITLREGEGKQFKIIKMIEAGAPLEVLEESELYLKVRTRSGIEGWVLKQYVTSETPKTDIIAALERQIDRLNTKIAQHDEVTGSLQDELNAARSVYDQKEQDLSENLSALRSEADRTARELKRTKMKYNALSKEAKNVVNLMKERDSLLESNNQLKTDTEQLQTENEQLKKSQMIWWFVAGGGVFLVGWIVGKISRQKRFY